MKNKLIICILALLVLLPFITACSAHNLDEVNPQADNNEPSIEGNTEHYIDVSSVIRDLNLPIVVQQRTYSTALGDSDAIAGFTRFKITTEGSLYGLSVPALGENWGFIASNVRHIAHSHWVRNERRAMFFIKSDNTLWGIGSNETGLLGDGTGVNRQEPIFIMDNVADVYRFGDFVYALLIDGTVMTWGAGYFEPVYMTSNVVRIFNHYGQNHLNRGQFIFQARNGGIYSISAIRKIERLMPEPVLYYAVIGGLHYFIDSEHTLIRRTFVSESSDLVYENEIIATGVEHFFPASPHAFNRNSFIITFDGDLFGIGPNENGELGDGTLVPRHEPVFVMSDVVFAREFGLLMRDGTLWMWTRNDPTPQLRYEDVALFVDWCSYFDGGRPTSGFTPISSHDARIHFADGRLYLPYAWTWGLRVDHSLENIMIPQTIVFD